MDVTVDTQLSFLHRHVLDSSSAPSASSASSQERR